MTTLVLIKRLRSWMAANCYHFDVENSRYTEHDEECEHRVNITFYVEGLTDINEYFVIGDKRTLNFTVIEYLARDNGEFTYHFIELSQE